MKKTMKLLAMLLAMLTLVSALTACGKSEEEQARNEIYEHMKEEAAADGVDLDTMMESEYAAYEQQKAESAKEWEEKADVQSQLEAQMPALVAAYETYTTSTNPAEIISSAEEFNRIHAECCAIAQNVTLVDTIIRQNVPHRNPIKECIYRGKALLAGSSIDPSYKAVQSSFYFNTITGDYKFVFRKMNDSYMEEYMVLLPDGSTYVPDLSAIQTMPSLSSYKVAFVTPDSLIIGVIANAEFKNYEFRFNDPTSTGVEYAAQQPDEGYEEWALWEGTFEEFNTTEIREASFAGIEFE